MSPEHSSQTSHGLNQSEDSGASLRTANHQQLLAKIESKLVQVGIIGLGYVGLPLARAFSDLGIAVLGFDVDPVKIDRLKHGESYIGHIPDTAIRQMRERQFDATFDFQRLNEPDVVIICVPTPLTDARDPDLTYIVNSVKAIALRLRPGQLVVLESTTYPSTTRDVVLPALGRLGTKAWDRCFSGVQPRARGSGQPAVLGRHHPQGGWGTRPG